MDGLEDIPLVVTAQPLSFYIPASEVGRLLPSREVTRESIVAAYVQFILFCNPAYPQDTDPVPLKEVFLSPPTSNKKTFDSFEIYIQVKKLYDLEIRTWNQLALSLGVEPASADEGGGSQRVQQYMVRLKRWMKFSHIDAFFHYLAGRTHDYYMTVPPVDDPHPLDGRDGVPTAEDLALRALDPRLRPKRGRKRLESSVEDLPPAQRHTFAHTPSSEDRRAVFATPTSALPRSGFPTSAVTDPRGREPWSAISAAYTNQIGMSATEPRSAFSAFPVDPRVDQIRTPIVAHRINKWAATTSPSPDMHSPSRQSGHAKPPPRPHSNLVGPPLSIPETIPRNNDAPLSAVSAASTSSRRERQRLQLQVPPHIGGPVRLMTPPMPPPPPAILESEVEVVMVDDIDGPNDSAPVPPNEISNILAALKRSLAADLLRGDISGREKRLTSAEAKSLAISMLQRMGLGNDASKLTSAHLLSAAVQLGLAHMLPLDKTVGTKLSFTSAYEVRKELKVQYASVDEEGYEVLFESEASAGGEPVKPVFDVQWTLNSGAVRGVYTVRGLRLDDTIPAEVKGVDKQTEMARLQALEAASGLVMREVREFEGVDIYADHAGRAGGKGATDEAGQAGQKGLDWREKYFELERLNKDMRNVLEQARDRMINAVLTL